MLAAFTNLANDGITPNNNTAVRTTYYYVKFKPQDFAQYETLHQDTTLNLSDFPIESNILQNGNRYHDPSLPDSVPTYQYTAVKVGYQFAEGIPYEIIDSLYIPETDENLQYKTGGTNDVYVEKLLNKAYTQTANYEDTIAIDTDEAAYLAKSYRPGGRIQINDSRLNRLIGMQGVRMQARRWFVVYHAVCDFNGNYRMLFSFNRPCNYSAWFATPTFTVTQHFFGTTFWINGPKTSSDWNHDINDGYDRFAGHVFRGAFRYHFRDIGGLQRPYLISMRQRYQAIDDFRTWSGINWIVFPVIKVARFGNTDQGVREYISDEIFSTTCHETAHSSHFLRMGSIGKFILVNAQLRESWAVAIEWELTFIEYAERGVANYGKENYFPLPIPPQFPNSYAYQYWTRGIHDAQYTPIYIDIVDWHNQLNRLYFQMPNGSIADSIGGYRLWDIERFSLSFILNHDHLRLVLKGNKPTGVTNANIDLLINQYN